MCQVLLGSIANGIPFGIELHAVDQNSNKCVSLPSLARSLQVVGCALLKHAETCQKQHLLAAG